MADKFSRGTRVRHKSGGPVMTVVEYGEWSGDTERKVLCKWFNQKNSMFQEDTFFEEELLPEDSSTTAGGVAARTEDL